MAEYKTLYNVSIEHTYYTNGVSPDFTIQPLPETARLLKDNGLLFRKTNTGFKVLYRSENESATPFLPFGDLDLKFAMYLDNKASFENITDLYDNDTGTSFESGNLVYFRNEVQTDTVLQYGIIDAISSSSFTYVFPQTEENPGDTGEIVITNEQGQDVTPSEPSPTGIEPNGKGEFTYPIDFDSMPSGLYTFTTTVNGVDEESRRLYIDNELMRQRPFGLIKIHVVNEVDFPTDRLYTANFVHRETEWQYRLIVKTDSYSIEDSFSVRDTGPGGNFNRIDDENNRYFTNGIPTAIFNSPAPLAIKEQPIDTLLLRKQGMGVIQRNLPNPATLVVSMNTTIPPLTPERSVIYITV